MTELEYNRLHNFINECIEFSSTEASCWAYTRVKQHLNGYKITEPLPRSKGTIAIDEINTQLANGQCLGPVLIEKSCKCERETESYVQYYRNCPEVGSINAEEDR